MDGLKCDWRNKSSILLDFTNFIKILLILLDFNASQFKQDIQLNR